MKFSCEVSALLTGVQLVSRAIGSDQVLPILQNILLKAEGNSCTLSATNLEVSIITTIPIEQQEDGVVTIPMKAFLHFLQYNSDDRVVIEVKEGTHVHLHSKKAKAVLIGEDAKGFPHISSIQSETQFTLPLTPLLSALHFVTFTSAKTMTRPVLSGVLWASTEKNLTIVATDSYRLSEYVFEIPNLPNGIQSIIPARFLDEVRGVMGVIQSTLKEEVMTIRMNTQQIEMHIGSTTLSSRLIEGKFPDYTQILPKEKKTTITVKAKDLLSTIKRLHYFAKEQSNNITFSIENSIITLTTRETQYGRDEATIEGKVEGEMQNKIALSSLYSIDFLSRLTEEEVVIDIIDRFHPAVFRVPKNAGVLHLVMPLRIVD